MREFVKVLPLGLLLPLVIGAASVKPDDAISNISDWAHRLGFEGAAHWLANPAADNRIIAGSLGVAAIYAFMVWTVPAIRERRANPQSERLGIHLWTMLFYFMCTALVVGVWRFVPAQPTTPKIAGVPISQLISRMDNIIFACDVPPPDTETAAKFPAEIDKFKKNLDIFGDVAGLTYTVSPIRGGIRIVAEATTPEAKRRLLSAVSKLTVDIRRLGEKEIVNLSMDLPEILRFWSFLTPEPSASEVAEVRRKIEIMLGVADGKCSLI
jgi:hypothetical protein